VNRLPAALLVAPFLPDTGGNGLASRRLRDAPRLGERLAANALDLVRRRYARADGVARLRGLFGGATL
jgi:hypothetical protein